MAKLKKEYNPNRPDKRLRRPIIYIICEGKETETLYFRNFRARNYLVDIVPMRTKHTAAEHLVKHAKALLSQAEYSPKDGDEIWCVFDRDENTNAEITRAAQYANQKPRRGPRSGPARPHQETSGYHPSGRNSGGESQRGLARLQQHQRVCGRTQG